jgi:hypothetical protein
MLLLKKRILLFLLLIATVANPSRVVYAQSCAPGSNGSGCAASGQRCDAGNGNFGLCTPTDGNSSCDCQSASIGTYSLSVVPPTPSPVNPGDSAASTVTVSSISQPSSNTFYQGVVNLSCSTGTAAVSCALNPAQIFVSGNSPTLRLNVSTFTSLPLNPAGTPAGTYSITVSAKDLFGTTPQNGSQCVPLSVTNPAGGGRIAWFVFVASLSLWTLWRLRRDAKAVSR